MVDRKFDYQVIYSCPGQNDCAGIATERAQ